MLAYDRLRSSIVEYRSEYLSASTLTEYDLIRRLAVIERPQDPMALFIHSLYCCIYRGVAGNFASKIVLIFLLDFSVYNSSPWYKINLILWFYLFVKMNNNTNDPEILIDRDPCSESLLLSAIILIENSKSLDVIKIWIKFISTKFVKS